MAELEEFLNVDADEDSGDEETKDAKALWVRVANSTSYAMEVETFIYRAQRQEVQGVTVEASLKLKPIPGVEITPSTKVERPRVPLVHNTPGPGGPDPTVNPLPGYVCDQFWGNADTDENSELMTLRITKMDAGGPQFPGKDGPARSLTITKKHKHGVIIINDPDKADQLLVIPAAGQFFLNNPWKPHPDCRNPNFRKNYDPMA